MVTFEFAGTLCIAYSQLLNVVFLCRSNLFIASAFLAVLSQFNFVTYLLFGQSVNVNWTKCCSEAEMLLARTVPLDRHFDSIFFPARLTAACTIACVLSHCVDFVLLMQKPGYSTEMLASSLDINEYPHGSAWQALFDQGTYPRPDEQD